MKLSSRRRYISVIGVRDSVDPTVPGGVLHAILIYQSVSNSIRPFALMAQSNMCCFPISTQSALSNEITAWRSLLCLRCPKVSISGSSWRSRFIGQRPVRDFENPESLIGSLSSVSQTLRRIKMNHKHLVGRTYLSRHPNRLNSKGQFQISINTFLSSLQLLGSRTRQKAFDPPAD